MILLTGATGKTGSETAKALAAKGVKARALVRNPEKAAALKALGHRDRRRRRRPMRPASRQALAGVERLLMLLPNSQRQLELEQQLVDLAAKAGVRHVVKMSSMEAMAERDLADPADSLGIRGAHPQVRPRVDHDQAELLHAELARQRALDQGEQIVLHADGQWQDGHERCPRHRRRRRPRRSRARATRARATRSPGRSC